HRILHALSETLNFPIQAGATVVTGKTLAYSHDAGRGHAEDVVMDVTVTRRHHVIDRVRRPAAVDRHGELNGGVLAGRAPVAVVLPVKYVAFNVPVIAVFGFEQILRPDIPVLFEEAAVEHTVGIHHGNTHASRGRGERRRGHIAANDAI